MLSEKAILRERRGKSYDLRPLIEHLEVLRPNNEKQFLKLRLSAREGATGRPEEVLKALGIDPFSTSVHRTKLYLKEKIQK